MKTQSKKLLAYSAFTSSFLSLAHTADAQIVYSDIDPDTSFELSLFLPWTSLERDYPVDMNGDGVNEINFYIFSQSSPSSSGFASFRVLVDNYEGNYLRNNIYSSLSWQLEAIHEGDTIDSGDHWNADSRMLLGLTYSNFIYNSGSNYTLYAVAGNWHNKDNRYIGIKFKIDSLYHYGWLRLSIYTNPGADYDFLTLKSFAYEATPGTAIIAGEDSLSLSESEVPLTVHGEFTAVSISMDQHALCISLPDNRPDKINMSVVSVNGQIIYNSELTATQTIIPLELSAGTYLVNLRSADEQYTQKIIVN